MRRERERGQILVVFAGGFIALMAIAALVIDLGFVFMIHRQEQNAADPGAIAAARFIRTGSVPDTASMRLAACLYAHQNGLFNKVPGDTTCASTSDEFGTNLEVHYPPLASAGPYAGRPGFVQVILTRAHNTFFGGILGLPSITVSSSAVAAYSNGDSNTSSLIALDPSNACATGHIHGTGTIDIHPVVSGTLGGFVQVNSSCNSGSGSTADDACSASSGALKVDSNASNFTAPDVFVVGSCQATSGQIDGTLQEAAPVVGDPLAELAPPRLSDYPNGQCGPGGVVTSPSNPVGCRFNTAGTIPLLPGVYFGGWDIRNNVTLQLAPGMYIFAGGGVTLNAGGSITSVQGSGGTPAPVMFFNTDSPTCASGGPCQAKIDFTASSALSLRPIASGPYRGILMWNDANGSNPTSVFTLGGQTSLDIAGTIYNPKGSVTLEGGAVGSTVNTASVQVISWHWDVGGNSTLNMPYDPSQLYHLDEKGLVH